MTQGIDIFENGEWIDISDGGSVTVEIGPRERYGRSVRILANEKPLHPGVERAFSTEQRVQVRIRWRGPGDKGITTSDGDITQLAYATDMEGEKTLTEATLLYHMARQAVG